MMAEFSFPHHTYQHAIDAGEYEFIPADQARGGDHLGDTVPIANALRVANVTQIMLIHGTFAGDDVLGLMRELTRVFPGAADSLKALGKRLFDQVAGEVGNYTEDFANQLSTLVNQGQSNPISVSRFSWSGENHHLGRAGGALALLDQLLDTSWEPNQRLLIWAHSHGGNLLALLSNLVGCSSRAMEEFFSATRSHYQDPVLGRLDLPVWDRMRKELAREGIRDRLPILDVVTFGTPVRYRWNRQVCSRLLHFVQHRPLDADHPVKACLPLRIQDMATAAGGDYVQQLGIGGTDFLHSVLAWRSWNSERRLRRMLEPSARRRDLPKNLRHGHRVSLDGKTLLVDYPDVPAKWNQVLLGHGVYTRSEWLPFHLHEIANRIYAS